MDIATKPVTKIITSSEMSGAARRLAERCSRRENGTVTFSEREASDLEVFFRYFAQEPEIGIAGG